MDLDRGVDDALIARCIDSAVWAPNHKRTWPWRFTVLRGDSRAHFGEALSDAAARSGGDEFKVAKLRTKYLRAPVVVLTWTVVSDDPVRAREDREATAAAVQTFLLTATSLGLASFWATVGDDLVGAARAVAGLDETYDLVAIVYVGWPIGDAPIPPRPPAPVTWL